MNGLINDVTADGWIALYISILKCVPPSVAFELLDNPDRKLRKWTEDDIRDIDDLRKAGWAWDEISEMYNSDKTNLCHLYKRGKKKYHIE